MDLDKALADYKSAYLSYPQVRRDVEFKLMAALVEEVKTLKGAARWEAATRTLDALPSVSDDEIAAHVVDLEKKIEAFVAENKTKRGPGRPPKVEEAA